MYILFEQMLNQLEEAINDRIPVYKVSMASDNSSVAKAIDMQHLNKNNIVGDSIKLLTQLLYQFNTLTDIKFNVESKEYFNLLNITITADAKMIMIIIGPLTNDELNQIKEKASVTFSRLQHK